VAWERAHAEKLVEAVRARDDFLSIASHELKTPLAAFQLNLNAIERGLSQMSQSTLGERLEMARRSVRRLAKLIEMLLDVSQLTTGRMELSPAQVDLATIVSDVVASSEEEARRLGTPLSVHLESPVAGHFDPNRMGQVVHHLLSNALKFGQGRPVELSLRSQGPTVVLSVVDHGIGIPPDEASGWGSGWHGRWWRPTRAPSASRTPPVVERPSTSTCRSMAGREARARP
jgi:signal transduction histidine kinase